MSDQKTMAEAAWEFAQGRIEAGEQPGHFRVDLEDLDLDKAGSIQAAITRYLIGKKNIEVKVKDFTFSFSPTGEVVKTPLGEKTILYSAKTTPSKSGRPRLTNVSFAKQKKLGGMVVLENMIR